MRCGPLNGRDGRYFGVIEENFAVVARSPQTKTPIQIPLCKTQVRACRRELQWSSTKVSSLNV